MREKIWYKLLDTKFQAYYFEELVTHYQKIERRLNIFLAIASFGSVASWAVSNKYEILWASIVAASSIITVIKPYFPFHKYINEVNKTATQLQNLNLDLERLWYKSENDHLLQDEIFEEYMELKKRCLQILDFRDDTIITDKPKLIKEAENRMESYLRNNFNVEHEPKHLTNE